MKNIKQSMISGFAFSITALSTFLAYGAFVNMTEVTSSDTLTATGWNNMISNINDLNNRVNNINLNSSNIPTGFIGSFNLTTCPTGWKPADGTNSTPDLRGQFLRGLNTFNGGTTTRSDGKQDPETRILGNYQEDAFQSHVHGTVITAGGSKNWGVLWSNPAASDFNHGYNTGGPLSDGINGIPRTSNETRPKNVAVIFCIKD